MKASLIARRNSRRATKSTTAKIANIKTKAVAVEIT
jgi:hypothetical protein